MKNLFSVLGAAFIVMFVSACARQPDAMSEAKIYSNLLFIGAYDNRQYRVSAETLFTDVLKKEGIEAAPSYNLLPGLENIQSNTQVADKLKGTQYDGVLVVTVLAKRDSLVMDNYEASKGFMYLLDGRPRRSAERGSFIAWAGTGSFEIYAGLWDAETLRPVWQVTTDAKTTGSDTEDNKLLAEFVAEQLKQKGVVKLQSQ